MLYAGHAARLKFKVRKNISLRLAAAYNKQALLQNYGNLKCSL